MKFSTGSIRDQKKYNIPTNFGKIKTLKIDGKYKRFTIKEDLIITPTEKITQRFILLARNPWASGLEIIINVELKNAKNK